MIKLLSFSCRMLSGVIPVLLVAFMPVFASSAYALPAGSDTPSNIPNWGVEGRAYFFFPDAIVIDGSGNRYVTDEGSILKLDSSGNYLAQWGGSGTNDGEFQGISDLALDPSGNLYVSDKYGHRIQKFDSAGNFLLKWGTNGSGDGQFNQTAGIALDSTGNVYVVDRYNNRIQKFDSSGNFLAKWGVGGFANGEFDQPYDIAIDAAGNVYVTDSYNHRIQKFDSTGVYLSQWGSQGSGNGELFFPEGLSIDGSGNLYVTDTNNGRIQKFDSAGNYLAQSGVGGFLTSSLYFPHHVAFDSAGNIYVTDGNVSMNGNNDAGIHKYDSAGNFLSVKYKYREAEGYLSEPSGVDTDAAGNVYVADTDNSRIVKFDSSGEFLDQFGIFGSGDGQLNNPTSVAVDPSGNVFVGDRDNNRIQKFDSSGNFVTKWGSQGSGDGEFSAGYFLNVAVDLYGNVYVADSDNYRIQKFDNNGVFLTKWGIEGSGNGELSNPLGITFDGDGNLLVVDNGNTRIQKFDVNGSYLAQWGIGGAGSTQSLSASSHITPFDDSPYLSGITTDIDGNIYVTEVNDHVILKYDSAGNYLTQWGQNGSSQGEFDNPYAIASDASGNLYVADTGNDRIQKFDYLNSAVLTETTHGKPIDVTAPSGTTLTCQSAQDESDQIGQDGSYSYPVGLVDFCFTTSTTSNDVSLTFVTDLQPGDVVARKYNPLTNSYGEVPGAIITATTYQGQPALTLTYAIVDNGPLDVDPDIGEIADPVGLAVAVSSANLTNSTGNNAGSTPGTAEGTLAATGGTVSDLLTFAFTLLLVGFVLVGSNSRVCRTLVVRTIFATKFS